MENENSTVSILVANQFFQELQSRWKSEEAQPISSSSIITAAHSAHGGHICILS